ncbi:MAG: hypothetical protein ABIG20_05015 [archaeon]
MGDQKGYNHLTEELEEGLRAWADKFFTKSRARISDQDYKDFNSILPGLNTFKKALLARQEEFKGILAQIDDSIQHEEFRIAGIARSLKENHSSPFTITSLRRDFETTQNNLNQLKGVQHSFTLFLKVTEEDISKLDELIEYAMTDLQDKFNRLVKETGRRPRLPQ